MLAYFMNKNKSFMNKLNSIRPNIELCGTPEINIFNRLSMLFILTFFLLFLNKSTWKLGNSLKIRKQLFWILVVMWITVKSFLQIYKDSPNNVFILLSRDFSVFY